LPGDLVVESMADHHLELRPVSWANVNDVLTLRSEAVAHTMRQMLVDGYQGVYAYEEGGFVGHFWARLSGSRRAEMWEGVEFGLNEALLCWGWIGHTCRGRGFFQVLIVDVVQRLRLQHGPIKIIADVPVEPIASLFAHSRRGFQLTARIDFTRIMGKTVRIERTVLTRDDLEMIVHRASHD
jgi:hypothetical protein